MKSYRWLFWLLAGTGLLLDQSSKYAIFSHLYNHGAGGEIVVVEDYFTIETAQFSIRLHGTWTGKSEAGNSIQLTFAGKNVVKVQMAKDTFEGTYLAESERIKFVQEMQMVQKRQDRVARLIGREKDKAKEQALIQERHDLDTRMRLMQVQLATADFKNWAHLRFQGESGAIFELPNGPLKVYPMKDGVKIPNKETIFTRGESWPKGDTAITEDSRPRVNEGALFGFGSGHNWVFAVVSIAAALLIIGFSGRPAVRQDRLLCVALGLILAGTLGNFYDRIVFDGVRDFIHWFIRRDNTLVFDWPVFNIADCCLVVGAGTLLIHAFFFTEPTAAPAPPKEQPSAVVPS